MKKTKSELLELATIAKDELIKHDLWDKGWRFAWNNRKSAFGICRYRERTVELSRFLSDRVSMETMLDTLLHEIAHALAGGKAGHGPEWKKWARRLGCDPKAVKDVDLKPEDMEFKYAIIDDKGEILKGYHKRPSRKMIRSLPNRFLSGRKAATLGKLKAKCLVTGRILTA
jgi:predicted SprT family Zn-dependent metalloprotease